MSLSEYAVRNNYREETHRKTQTHMLLNINLLRIIHYTSSSNLTMLACRIKGEKQQELVTTFTRGRASSLTSGAFDEKY